MESRRKFLLQGALAAGAAAFLKPLESIAAAPGIKNRFTNNLVILHSSYLHSGHLSVAERQRLKECFGKMRRQKGSALLIAAITATSAGNALSDAGLFDVAVPADYNNLSSFIHALQSANDPRLKAVAQTYINYQLQPDGLLPFQLINKGDIKTGFIDAGIITPYTKNPEKVASQMSKTALFLKEGRNCRLIISGNYNVTAGKDIKEHINLAELTTGVDLMLCSGGEERLPVTYIARNAADHEVIISAVNAISSPVARVDISYNLTGHKRTIDVPGSMSHLA